MPEPASTLYHKRNENATGIFRPGCARVFGAVCGRPTLNLYQCYIDFFLSFQGLGEGHPGAYALSTRESLDIDPRMCYNFASHRGSMAPI
jgi:hypothetical protein